MILEMQLIDNQRCQHQACPMAHDFSAWNHVGLEKTIVAWAQSRKKLTKGSEELFTLYPSHIPKIVITKIEEFLSV